MTYFIRNGNKFIVTDNASMDLHEKLPANNYVVKMDQYENLFLEEISMFTPLTKYYGDTVKNAERILNTFKDRTNSTGVLLNGEKGSGKTLLAKHLSIIGYSMNMPTIIINTPWCGDKFNTFIQSIEQPCIIMFDEFEKVYDRDQQESILTLLDGVFPSSKLFVLTCNDKFRIDDHLRNRPGRIFYMIDFVGLTVEFIKEYCEDKLNDKSQIDTICKAAQMFSQFNFDILQALVEDMNRYNETPQETLRILNAKPSVNSDDESAYVVILEIDGNKIPSDLLHHSKWYGNPLADSIVVNYELSGDNTSAVEKPDYPTPISKPSSCRNSSVFSSQDLVNIDGNSGSYSFINKDKEKLNLVKIMRKDFNFMSLLM